MQQENPEMQSELQDDQTAEECDDGVPYKLSVGKKK